VLWQAWAFVAPGLYQHEKRIALPLVFVSTVLFMAGIAFCYFFVFGRVFAFINEFAPKSITPAPDIENYLNFVLTMFVAFGITFEIPVIVMVMVKAGIIGVAKLKEIRPYVVVGNFVVAAILTPPDVVSQFMLAIPMCLLYELGILFAGIMAKAKSDSTNRSPDTDLNKPVDRPEAGN
jgi:sec-independent protein translocase protein TatC